MDYDFIEIGTSDFATIVEESDYNATGICIEPIKEYIQTLPFRPNVRKVVGALVPEPTLPIDLYYIDSNDIDGEVYRDFLRGCNKIGSPHDHHIHYTGYDQYYPDLPARNLVEEGLVKTRKVRGFTFEHLSKVLNIDSVKLIKLDTEGMDTSLVNSILDYYNLSQKPLPKQIEFETNHHNNSAETLKLCFRLMGLNYKLQVGDSWYKSFRDFNGSLENDCIAILQE